MKTDLMKESGRRLLLTLMMALLVTGAGCPPKSGDGGSAIPGDDLRVPGFETDLIQENNEIVVRFSGIANPPNPHQERVKADGTITLPQIGPVQAAGKTRGELEQLIHARYTERFYQDHLSVNVTNESRYFYVSGEVRTPSQLPYLTGMTVMKAIAQAGDFTPFAKKDRVRVVRDNGELIIVDCGGPAVEVPVYPGDRIEVPRRILW